MSEAGKPTLSQLRAVCATSPFSAWAGFELVAAADGHAVLRMATRPDLLQHSGFVHAAILAGLIDTAAGFAAASVAGSVLTSNFQVTAYRPATGSSLVARAQVVRAGRRQIFVNVEVFASAGERDSTDDEKLVAGGNALLMTTA